MPLDHEIFGEGVYTPQQAARLIGGSAVDIIRWTRGTSSSEPIWNARYSAFDDSTAISFLDLIETRVVGAFRRAGVSLQAVRTAILIAQEKYGIERPLSSLSFKTDGKEIVFKALEDEENYESLSRKNPGQKIFGKIVELSLRDLDYENGRVVRWRPTADKEVIIDPRRSFGAPILEKYGISTGTLLGEHKLGMTASQIGKLYEIPTKYVNSAIKYERSLDKHDPSTI
ncbi:hypothetical protein [Paracoccus zhejiangensis]|uniref:hypothetical protein n=1 Tax=Paracoccus zhejiangensis TaxID=1077935 RepID=UPI001300163F|nr:hypothetical protein [Paracoccus zhejiangensis]